MTLLDPLLDVYEEPCADCHAGRHGFCTGRAPHHPTDETYPCPCRSAGHSPEETPHG